MTTETEGPPGRSESFQRRLFRNPAVTIGLVVGGLGILVGIGAVVWQAIVTRAPLGQVLLVMAVPAVFIAIIIFAVALPTVRQNRLMNRGRPAKAVIAGLSDTGVTMNQNPQVRLELDVRRPDGTTYRATTTAVVSRLVTSLYVPGTEVDVMVDPSHPEQVALVDLAPGRTGSSSMSEAEALKKMTEIDNYNRRLLTSGEPARATIVRADPIGVMVNGRNPGMKFLLKVHPVGAEPFLAEAAGVVAEESVAKCRPGCEIHVRFENSDRTRVGLDHS